MKKLKKKLISKISMYGDGTTEFETSDMEQLLNHIQRLEQRVSAIDYLGSQNKGISYHRVAENSLNKDLDWNQTEKLFSDAWIGKAEELGSILKSNFPYPLEVKITNKVKITAATVIQWLGSNIGWEFLISTLKTAGYEIVKIKNEKV